MTKLPKKFKRQWTDALMSGKYQQGSYFLKNNGKHCCLGVACEVAGIKATKRYAYINENLAQGKIPKAIIHEHNYEVSEALSTMNDDGVPFEVIAGFINEYL